MTSLKGIHAIAYVRVSTDDKGQTVESQKREIGQWASRTGAIIDATYEDNQSGADFPRPGLSMAIAHVVANRIPILVCYDQSRLTRSPEHLPIIMSMLNPCSVRYTAIDIDPEQVSGRLLSAIKSVTDSEERKILSDRTKMGMKTRQIQGIHCGRPRAFMFTEDIAAAPVGAFRPGVTVTMTKPDLMAYSHAGHSVLYVCKRVLRNPTTGKPLAQRTVIMALTTAGLYDEYLANVKKAKGIV